MLKKVSKLPNLNSELVSRDNSLKLIKEKNDDISLASNISAIQINIQKPFKKRVEKTTKD